MTINPIAQEPGQLELAWYAIRALPRHEKRVRDRLKARQVECFLPLMTTQKRWKNGLHVATETPLFPTYLFVRTQLQQRYSVLGTEGVHSFIGTARGPSPIDDREIEVLQSGLPQAKVKPHSGLAVGDKVTIIAGPLCGLTGVVVREPGQLRVVLTVSVIMQGVSVEVDTSDIVPFVPTRLN